MPDGARPVPWRTITATIAVVLAAGVGILLLQALARIIAWLVVALFLTVVLTPPVDYMERHFHLRRGRATAAVFVSFIAIVLALGYVFVRPIIDQGTKFVDNLPKLVDDAQK